MTLPMIEGGSDKRGRVSARVTIGKLGWLALLQRTGIIGRVYGLVTAVYLESQKKYDGFLGNDL